MVHVRHARVDVTHERRAVERRPDVGIEVAGRVDVRHPVVAVGSDAEAIERVDEELCEVARVARVAVTDGIGDVGERPAHLPVDCVGREQGLRIHGVHVVDAVEVRRLEPGRAQRPDDDVEDHRPAQAADVHRPRRRLRVVDDLRARDACRELIRPIHGGSLSGQVGARRPRHTP